MPEFLTLHTPSEAQKIIIANLPKNLTNNEEINTSDALGRILADDLYASESIPAFNRSTVDGYAVKSRDTYGASETLPIYLNVIGEIKMGQQAEIALSSTEAALIHTGGMLPEGADSVVMVEYTDQMTNNEIAIYRPVGANENLVKIGEDVQKGELIFKAGTKIRPGDIGGLMALGITKISVYTQPVIGLISTGDEVVDPHDEINLGQVRDINSYTLKALVEKNGGLPKLYGIVGDSKKALEDILQKAHAETDLVIVTAGSSASTRDLTAEVVDTLGKPGVLVHGVNIRPGKPTILAVCNGKPVVGLPGNPVSAFVIANLFVSPIIKILKGEDQAIELETNLAITKTNIVSVSGREEWVPVQVKGKDEQDRFIVEPIFYKSNLIFSIIKADGLIRVPEHANGINANSEAEFILL